MLDTVISSSLEYTLQTRKNMISLLQTLDMDQLNTVPKGFNNNILWNAGHILVTQQLLNYKLAGLPLNLNDDFIDLFKKGTKVDDLFDASVLEFIVDNAEDLILQTREDLASLDFSNFNEYPTSFGTVLKNIDDAIAFNSMHECLHLGYMMAQKRTILANF